MLKANCFIDLLDTPMGRRNSYLCFANANEGGSQFGKNTLYLATCKSGGGGMMDLMRPNTCRQVKLELVKNGQKLPTVIDTTETEVILRSDAGSIRFCIAGTGLVYVKGTEGLSLQMALPADSGAFPSTWETASGGSTSVKISPLSCLLPAA